MAAAAEMSPCAVELRRHDPDRLLTALFADADRREALFALYAFNLEVARTREMVSEPMLGQMRLQWWREAIEGIYVGNPRSHPVVRGLAAAIVARGLPREPFDRLIDARADDLYDRPPADLAALEAYASATSAGLNRLLLAVLGVDDARALAAGDAVGMAWALTGLIRGAPAHAALRRVHLPADWLAEAGTDRDRFFLAPTGPEARAVLRRLAARAQEHLETARAEAPRVPREARAVLLLGRLTRLYLDRLQQAGFDPTDARVRIGMPRRQLAVLLAAWRGRL